MAHAHAGSGDGVAGTSIITFEPRWIGNRMEAHDELNGVPYMVVRSRRGYTVYRADDLISAQEQDTDVSEVDGCRRLRDLTAVERQLGVVGYAEAIQARRAAPEDVPPELIVAVLAKLRATISWSEIRLADAFLGPDAETAVPRIAAAADRLRHATDRLRCRVN